MARARRNSTLETRTARSKLGQRAKPYWCVIEEGGHLGYYRGSRVSKWLARYREPGSSLDYQQTTLGEADDFSDPDAAVILSWSQAQGRARDWFDLLRRNGGRKPIARSDGALATAGGRRRGYTVGDALDDYIAGFTGKSVVHTRSRLEAIIRPALGHLEVDRLTTNVIKKWLDQRAKSPARLRTKKDAAQPNTRTLDTVEATRRRQSTANRDLNVLKAALNAAYEAGRVMHDDAWRRVRRFKNADQAKLRYLTDEEARRLVNSCQPAFRPMVQASLLTGARYGELAAACVRDFDPEEGTLTLNDTKADKPRRVFLTSEAVELCRRHSLGKLGSAVLFARPDGKKWNASQQARPLADACQSGQIEPRATFHDLRRTFGARLARKDTPMAVIAAALGHADERITHKHYAHLSPSYIKDTIRDKGSGLGVLDLSDCLNVVRLN